MRPLRGIIGGRVGQCRIFLNPYSIKYWQVADRFKFSSCRVYELLYISQRGIGRKTKKERIVQSFGVT